MDGAVSGTMREMDPVSLFLLTIAGIFIIGIVGEVVFERTGVPDVVWLMLVGLVLGPLTGFVSQGNLSEVAPYFGALTLVVVLFDGGSKLKLRELKTAAWRSTLLATLSFVLSVSVITVASMVAAFVGILPDDWSWLHGLILGSILGGSSSVVIMPALRKAGLSPELSNLVNLESAITDVLCVVSTVAFINILVSGQTDVGGAGATLGKAFGIGLGGGLIAGLLALLLLRPLRKSNYAYPLTFGALLLIYVMIDELGGSAALAILACAVLLGNAPELSKVVGLARTAKLNHAVTTTHDEITFIIKSFFFTFIGAMLGPVSGELLFGIFLGMLLLVARAPAVLVGCLGSGLSWPAKGLVGVSMPRGLAAGVLAGLPLQAGVEGAEAIRVPVFAAVFTTIMVFAVGFPILKARLASENQGDAPPGDGSGEVEGAGGASSTTAAESHGGSPEPTAGAEDSAAAKLPEGAADQTVLDGGLPAAMSDEPETR